MQKFNGPKQFNQKFMYDTPTVLYEKENKCRQVRQGKSKISRDILFGANSQLK